MEPHSLSKQFQPDTIMGDSQHNKMFQQKIGEMQSTTSRENRPDARSDARSDVIIIDDDTPSQVKDPFPEETLSAIIRNQLLIDNNQIKIMSGLAQLATSVEMLKNQVLSMDRNVQAPEPSTPVSHVEFKPINSPEELDLLEEELKDEAIMKRYVAKLSAICGTGGTSDGIDCAYRLIDYMATREMIHKCSWTGQARDQTEASRSQPGGSYEFETSVSKIPLKFYTKFRELFFRVIQLADHNFSEASSEKFLKCIMQNSKQRLSSKVMSARKNRPKNLKYRFKKDDDKKDETPE